MKTTKGNTMDWMAKQAGLAAAAACLLAWGSGCVAFNVGKPDVFVHRDTVVESAEPPHKVEVMSVEPRSETEGRRIEAWLEADVQTTHWQWQHDDTVTVKQHKRLAVGFFPAAAEAYLKPRGALDPILEGKQGRYFRDPARKDIGVYPLTTFLGTKTYNYTREYVVCQLVCLLPLFGVPQALGTLKTVLFEPFTDWSPLNDFYDRKNTESYFHNQHGIRFYVLDASVSPKIKLLARFSKEERQKMGFRTCLDPVEYRWLGGQLASHLGVVGFHKHLAVFVEGGTEPRKRVEQERQRTERMQGPYEVTLRIPGASVSRTLRVEEGTRKATFDLPPPDRSGTYEATLEFRSLYAGEDAVRKSWKTRTLRQTVWLQGKNGVSAASPSVQVVEIVKEVPHYSESRAVPEREFEVEKGRDGRWRVRILAGNLDALDADRKAKPKILESLRDEFAERNPDVPRSAINAWAAYTTEDGGRTLVYEGAATSLIPELESMTYSRETRRGTVTMRLADRTGLAKSKQFVRENIAAIVCDKNVALAAGERPPDGAKYRSLDENFAGGVLTVEFEAEE